MTSFVVVVVVVVVFAFVYYCFCCFLLLPLLFICFSVLLCSFRRFVFFCYSLFAIWVNYYLFNYCLLLSRRAALSVAVLPKAAKATAQS